MTSDRIVAGLDIGSAKTTAILAEVAHVETSLIYEHARNTKFGGAETL